jgi:hypothetical protein
MNPNPHPVTIGLLEQDRIVDQLVHVAQLRQLDPAEMTTWDDDQWAELAAAALNIDHGQVRLSVLRRMP